MEADFTESLRMVLRGQGDISEFDLTKVTTFDWDTAHVFRPYTREKVVNATIGSEIHSRSINLRDDVNLFVFTRGSEVVLTVDVPRGVCDFELPAAVVTGTHFSVANQEALFQVVIDETVFCRATPVNVIRL